MEQSRGQTPDVRTCSDLEARRSRGVRAMTGWRLHGLDLAERAELLDGLDPAGALFVGCRLSAEQIATVRSRGAVVFPTVPGVPVQLDRSELYRPEELFDTPHYADSLDARAYAWSHAERVAAAASTETLPPSLHDHAIDTALARWTAGRSLVGVMGGHAVTRGTAAYATAAHLGRTLGARHTVATGGGPGAMEAANLGARFASLAPDALDEALALLATAPTFTPSIDAWLDAAVQVLRRFPEGTESLGVPTWHYGHEPPNVFASAIAKYFRNATREAVLLELCNAGIVFLPGAGGTVQELFQDACENYYADESSLAPMVLVGREYWTRTLPAWPLLTALAKGRPMENHIHLVDDAESAAHILAG